MQRIGIAVVILLVLAVFPLAGYTQTEQDSASKQTEEATEKPSDSPKVTAVYGILPDDYLPQAEHEIQPYKRSTYAYSRTPLPNSVFFIGASVFSHTTIGLMTSFIKEFEDEERAARRVDVRHSSDLE